jgi:hypothetical protein
MKIWKISRYAISLVYTVLLFICLLVCWLKGGKEKKEKSGCQRRGKDDCCKGWEGEEREESVWLARAEAWSSCRSMTFLFSSIWHSFVKQLILFCCRGIHWGFSMNRSTSRCPLVTWLQPGETQHVHLAWKICVTSKLDVEYPISFLGSLQTNLMPEYVG